MIPQFPQSLADLATKVTTEFAAQADSTYTAANLGMTGVLLQAAAQEAERHIDTHLRDINELTHLFASLNPKPFDEIQIFLESKLKSYTNTDVSQLHAHALKVLIQLHEWSESHHPELDAKIWAFLEVHVERHKLEVMP